MGLYCHLVLLVLLTESADSRHDSRLVSAVDKPFQLLAGAFFLGSGKVQQFFLGEFIPMVNAMDVIYPSFAGRTSPRNVTVPLALQTLLVHTGFSISDYFVLLSFLAVGLVHLDQFRYVLFG
jgi:hypothetical protein